MPTREEIIARRDALLADAEGILSSGERSDATEANLADIHTEVGELNARIEQFVRVDEARASSEALELRAGRAGNRRDEYGQADDAPSDLGGLFIDSPQYRSWLQTGGKSGVFESDVNPLLLRAALLTDDLPGVTPQNQRVAQATPTLMLPLTSLATRVPVSTNIIDWVVEGPDPQAGNVAEGAVKPEGVITSSVTPIALQTQAVWAQASRQLLEDSPAARAYINRKLGNAVAKRIEANIAAALVAATLPAVSAATLLEAIRVGIGTVEASGFAADAVILNPADYASLDNDVLRATLNGPVTRPSYWGLTVTASTSQPVGTATVGAVGDGLTLLTRNAISTYISDSHGETFTSNIFTILAEARSTAQVGPVEAFAECTATP